MKCSLSNLVCFKFSKHTNITGISIVLVDQFEPIYFEVNHGGGPLPLLNEFMFHSVNQLLRKNPDLIRKSEAIIIISAHWEELTISITVNQNVPMY
jgi:hypothetical protein